MTRIEELSIRYSALLESAKNKNSVKALASDWAKFSTWCKAQNLDPIPATDDQICAFLLDFEACKVSTLARYLWALEKMHAENGFSVHWPKSHKALASLKRTKKKEVKQARPLAINQIENIILKTGLNLIELRNRAILALGWAAALRAVEICDLVWADVLKTEDGLIVHVRRSKTDQEQAGHKISIPFAPVGAICFARPIEKYMSVFENFIDDIERPFFWGLNRGAKRNDILELANVKTKKAKLNPRTIGLIVRSELALAGYSTSGYSAHSLRAGFATSCAAAGVPEWAIRRITRHKSLKSLDGYIRIGELFAANHPLTLLQADRKLLRATNDS
jgi:site-specific recombinase XerD